MDRAIALRNAVCITMNEGVVLKLDGPAIMEHVSFVKWDSLPSEVRAGFIQGGWVATEGGRFGAMTREAVLDCLALKMAGVTPQMQWPSSELWRRNDG